MNAAEDYDEVAEEAEDMNDEEDVLEAEEVEEEEITPEKKQLWFLNL